MLTEVDAIDLPHHDVERGQVRTHPFLHARSRQRHEVPRSRRLRHARPLRRNIALRKAARRPVAKRLVTAVTPVTIEIALEALTSMEERDTAIAAQWRRRIFG